MSRSGPASRRAEDSTDGLKPRETEVYTYYVARARWLARPLRCQTWEWESAVVASGSQTHEYEHFQVRESLLRRALARTDATAFNPFPVTFSIVNNQIVVDQPYKNPASVYEGIYGDEDRFGRTNLFMSDAKINGRLWRLFNGGQIGVASGTELRYETYDDKRASFVGLNPPGSGSQFPYLREGDNDFLALSSNVPISAAQTIYAAYLETALPFVTRENRLPLRRKPGLRWPVASNIFHLRPDDKAEGEPCVETGFVSQAPGFGRRVIPRAESRADEHHAAASPDRCRRPLSPAGNRAAFRRHGATHGLSAGRTRTWSPKRRRPGSPASCWMCRRCADCRCPSTTSTLTRTR